MHPIHLLFLCFFLCYYREVRKISAYAKSCGEMTTECGVTANIPVLGFFTLSGRGVTANMSVLGTDDSGFESRRPDKVKNRMCRNTSAEICITNLGDSGFESLHSERNRTNVRCSCGVSKPTVWFTAGEMCRGHIARPFQNFYERSEVKSRKGVQVL